MGWKVTYTCQFRYRLVLCIKNIHTLVSLRGALRGLIFVEHPCHFWEGGNASSPKKRLRGRLVFFNRTGGKFQFSNKYSCPFLYLFRGIGGSGEQATYMFILTRLRSKLNSPCSTVHDKIHQSIICEVTVCDRGEWFTGYGVRS